MPGRESHRREIRTTHLAFRTVWRAAPLGDNGVYPRVNSNTTNRPERHEGLVAIVVSQDWFARSLLRSALGETGRFETVIEADDGYTALAEAWQAVADRHAADLILIDLATADASVAPMLTELRTAPELQRVLITAIGHSDDCEVPLSPRDFDFVSSCGVLGAELADTADEIAHRVLDLAHARR